MKKGSWLFQRSDSSFLQLSNLTPPSSTVSPFQVEAWVKLYSSDGYLFTERFVTSGDLVSITCGFTDGTTMTAQGLYPSFGYYNGSAWTTQAGSSIPLTLFSWTHVAFVFTGNSSKIYVNGIDVTKASSPIPGTTWGGSTTDSDSWYIGRRWDTTAGGTYLNGLVYDLRFITENYTYTGNFTPNSSGLSSSTTGTQLLTCNSYVYNTIVQDFGPFSHPITNTNFVSFSDETPINPMPGIIVSEDYNTAVSDLISQGWWTGSIIGPDYSAVKEPVITTPVYPALPPPAVRALIVAGGGGGGHSAGGGGGGGGVIYTPAVVVSSNTVYSIIVGTGGSGGLVTGAVNATSGTNSSFAELAAIGGGSGGSSNAAGGSGGSGGGGGNRTGQQGGSGTSDQGFAGGSSLAGDVSGTGSGGGGGGASEVGTTSTTTIKGKGGDGVTLHFTGGYRSFGGGGGGGMRWLSGIGAGTSDTVTGAPGGVGGGGTGGSGSNSGTAADTAGTAGTNTGGGGGGGGHDANSQKDGGGGGSGIVIIKYSNTYTAASVTGNPVSYILREKGQNWYIYEFTATGSITFL